MPIRLDDLLRNEGLTEADVVVTGQPIQPRESATPQRGIPLDQLLAQSATVATPQSQKPTKLELIAEAYRRGILPENKRPLYEEAVRRGLISSPTPSQIQSGQPTPRREIRLDDLLAQSGQATNIIWDDQQPGQSAGSQQSRIVWDDERSSPVITQAERQIPGVTSILAEADPQTAQRLQDTGVTPGTMNDFISLHAAHENRLRESKGLPRLNAQEFAAIQDIYRKAAGQQTLSNQNLYARQAKQERQQREESMLGRAENVGLNALTNFGDIGTNVIGWIAPHTAADMREEYRTLLNPNSESWSGWAGNTAAEVAKLVTAAKYMNPAAMAAWYGGQGFGSSRINTAELQDQGRSISAARDLLTATGIGTVEGLSGYAGGKIFAKMAQIARATPGVAELIRIGDKGKLQKWAGNTLRQLGMMAGEGVEEAATQFADNLITKAGTNPDQPLSEGVVQSGVMGALLAPFGELGASHRLGAEAKAQLDNATLAQDVANRIGGRGGETTVTVNGETAVVPKESSPAEAQATVQMTAEPSAVPPAPTLPEIPPESRDWSFNELKDWAQKAGYDVSETSYRRQLAKAINDQRQTQQANSAETQTFTPATEITPQGRNGVGNLVDPNTKVEWTDASGNTLSGVYVGREMNGDHWVYDTQGQQHKVKTADLRVLADQGTPTLEQQAKPPIPPEARDWSFTRLKKWATANGYKVGQAHNLDSVRKYVADQRGTSMTELPRLPKEAALWGDRRLRWWAEQNGYNVSEAVSPKEAKALIRQQRAASIATAKEDLQALKRGPEAIQALKSQRENPPGVPVGRDFSGRVIDAYRDAAEKARISAAKAAPPEGTSHKRRVPLTVEEWITPISSRIRDISASIYNRLMRMEFDTGVKRERIKRQLQAAATTLSESLGGKDSEKYQSFKTAVLNQNFDAAKALVPAEAQPAFDTFAQTFEGLIGDMQGAGVTIGRIENYWPRFLKDYKAFDAEFGNDKGRFEEAWELAKTVKGRRLLTAEEKAEIANSVLQGYGPRKPGSYGTPNARERRIAKISSEQADHYLDPFEAAFRYVDGAVYAAERAKFFGKSDKPEDVAASIGQMIQREVDAGHLNKEQQEELVSLLQTRAAADMVTMGRKTRTLRQMIHMATLGQFSSALNQIVDLATTAVSHGVGNTVKGAMAAMHITPAEHRIVMEELGIHDHGEEFKDVGKLARMADKVLTITGFKAMDRLGKETRVNAAWDAFRRTANNPKSEDFKRLEKEYRPVLGDKFDATMEDLRNDRRSEDARYLLFLDATKIQPVTLSQMPEHYLRMPNGRIVYTLKTFTVTQTDMLRREVLRKLATPGQRKAGLESLAKFVVYTTLLNLGKEMIKKLMRGQTISVEDIPDVAIDSMLGLVGLNRYTTTKAWSKPVDTLIDFIAPPLQWIDKSWADIVSGGKNGLSSVRYFPAVGELLYYHAPFGKGFNLNREQAKTDYRSKLKDLRSEIQYAVQNGDIDQADKLITIYNERRTQGPGDGRQSDLSLDSVYASLERKQKKQEQKEGR
ncbi:MAG: hypothetical protein ACM359_01000 [Bacillota bacterium]